MVRPIRPWIIINNTDVNIYTFFQWFQSYILQCLTLTDADISMVFIVYAAHWQAAEPCPYWISVSVENETTVC